MKTCCGDEPRMATVTILDLKIHGGSGISCLRRKGSPEPQGVAGGAPPRKSHWDGDNGAKAILGFYFFLSLLPHGLVSLMMYNKKLSVGRKIVICYGVGLLETSIVFR